MKENLIWTGMAIIVISCGLEILRAECLLLIFEGSEESIVVYRVYELNVRTFSLLI